MTIEILMDCVKNPIKAQVLLCLQKQVSLTAKELLHLNPSIPQATLYRTLKKMEEDNVIEVIGTEKKRGTVEKTYKLTESMHHSTLAENNRTLYAQMFSSFITSLLSEFVDYSKHENADVDKSATGFSAAPIYATPEELAEYGKQIQKILEPAFTKKSTLQKLHTFAMIFTPPREEDVK